MNYRPMTESDLSQVIEFWKNNYELSKRDTVERLKIFLQKNKDLSTVAVDDRGNIVGTVLASYDGRKGYIQKMAVSESLRGQGYGETLLKNTVEKLKQNGGLDIRVNCSQKLVPFYEKCGFEVKNVVSLQIREY